MGGEVLPAGKDPLTASFGTHSDRPTTARHLRWRAPVSDSAGDRGVGEEARGPSVGGRPLPLPALPLLPPHLTLLVVCFCSYFDLKLPSPTASLG